MWVYVGIRLSRLATYVRTMPGEGPSIEDHSLGPARVRVCDRSSYNADAHSSVVLIYHDLKILRWFETYRFEICSLFGYLAASPECISRVKVRVRCQPRSGTLSKKENMILFFAIPILRISWNGGFCFRRSAPAMRF